MVATSDFSGLVSSACALASAAAIAPIVSLERCMAGLPVQQIKAHRPGLGPLGPHPMPDRFLGILRHQALELGLGPLMVEKGRAAGPEEAGALGPGIGGAHVDHPHGLDSWPGRFDAEQTRGLAALDAPPELLLRSEQE